jgi:hypothetical protein
MMSARASCVLHRLAFSFLLLPGKFAEAEINYDLRQRGIQAMQAQNFAVARQVFLQLVERESSADNYNYLATAEASAGQPDLAMAHLQKSIQLGNRTGRGGDSPAEASWRLLPTLGRRYASAYTPRRHALKASSAITAFACAGAAELESPEVILHGLRNATSSHFAAVPHYAGSWSTRSGNQGGSQLRRD